jgi:hypothetical protein
MLSCAIFPTTHGKLDHWVQAQGNEDPLASGRDTKTVLRRRKPLVGDQWSHLLSHTAGISPGDPDHVEPSDLQSSTFYEPLAT